MKNKLVLFDWGNIVQSHQTGYTCFDAWNDLFISCGYKGNESAYKLIGKYRLDCITNEEDFKNSFEELSKEYGFDKSFAEFKTLYYDIFDNIDYYQDVADYEVSLKDRCYIGLFSNLTIFDVKNFKKEHDLSKYDYVFLSCEIGIQKPNINVFNIVQKKLPFKPEDILFIDDRKENVDAAISIGWNALQATGLELDKIKKRIDEFLE